MKHTHYYGAWIVFSISVVVAAIYALIRGCIRTALLRNSASGQALFSDTKLSSGLVDDIRTLYSKEQYRDTVRFWIMISRHLWLSGRYNDRVTIGQMIEDSASRLNMHEEQVQALIDDIGWTNLC